MQTEQIRWIVILLVIVFIGFLIYYNYFNKKQNESFSNMMETPMNTYRSEYPEMSPPSNMSNTGYGDYNNQQQSLNEGDYLSGAEQTNLDYSNPNVATIEDTNLNVSSPSGNMTNAPKASEPIGTNETYTSVSNFNQMKDGPTGLSNNQYPNDCYPKDQLTPSELLPGDANSTWAQVNPAGQGSLGDQNFLNAGFHVGVNTVGQTLRNANLQLRSEPPNPQVKVSPWLQSTIEPDTNRKPLEIGGC